MLTTVHSLSLPQVIFERLQRDNVLRYLNPYRMSDLKAIISLLIASKDPPVLDKVGIDSDPPPVAPTLTPRRALDPQDDLVEVVWKRQNKFLLPGDFVLKNWEDMTLKQLQLAVEDAHPTIFDNETLYPSYRTPVRQLTTKEAIMREYGCLEYIPGIVYCTYRGAMEVLEKMKTISGIMDLREDPAAAVRIGARPSGALTLTLLSLVCSPGRILRVCLPGWHGPRHHS